MENSNAEGHSRPNDGPSASLRRNWNNSWVALQDRLDKLFEPLSHAALEQANPAPGENVIDVGCGCGATVLDIAQLVGSAGRVLGVDISDQMLESARTRALAKGLQQVTLTLADAAQHPFVPQSVDLIFSRLGVMFFGNPVGAFSNLRRALKPTGRMVFVCVRTRAENTYISTAVQAARPLLPPAVMPVRGPEEPGMFSLADPTRVRRILGDADFHDIELLPFDVRMHIGRSDDPADAATFSCQFGPLPAVLDTVRPELREEIHGAVAEAYRRLATAEGIVLDGAFWIVTARP